MTQMTMTSSSSTLLAPKAVGNFLISASAFRAPVFRVIFSAFFGNFTRFRAPLAPLVLFLCILPAPYSTKIGAEVDTSLSGSIAQSAIETRNPAFQSWSGFCLGTAVTIMTGTTNVIEMVLNPRSWCGQYFRSSAHHHCTSDCFRKREAPYCPTYLAWFD